MKLGEAHASMDEEQEEDNSEMQARVSRSTKAKLLVRSHAMREEQSPPRAPSPRTNASHAKLPHSPQSSPVSPPNPVVVLSPSISRGNSPSRSPPSNVKMTVPPNKKCSPQCLSPLEENLHQRMRNLNLDRDDGAPRTEQSSHMESRRRYRTDSTEEPQNFAKEKTNVNHNGSSNALNVSRMSSRAKLRHQGSSQGSFEDNGEYKDTTGTDLNVFIPETLNRNPKDRAFMLRIEKELVSLARDDKKDYLKFPPMSSYQRMLVHRCAAYFGMEHNIEGSGKCVVVNRTRNTRIPEIPFRSHIKDDIIFSEEPRRSILKRESNSSDDYNFKSPDRGYGMENRRSKSYEEREEEYEKVRKRIFKGQRKDINSLDDILHWAEVAPPPWSSTDSEASTRYKLQLPDSHSRRHGKLLKVHSEEVSETMRPHVSKSYSFGGYGGTLTRGDSTSSAHTGPRLLTKQDSAASSVSWRLSPSSSGYKSQSQMSESVTPSPTSTPHMLRDSKRQDSMNSEYSNDKHDNPIVWAVTDIESVPKGSLIINPQTGQPIKNPDGSLYHYDPNNIPSVLVPRAKSPVSPRKSPTSPRRTAKLSPVTSPKKKSSKCSPIRRFTTTNSSTSPTLPYSPPGNMNKSYSFPPLQNETTGPTVAYPPFNISLPPPPMVGDPSLSMYNQPYFVPGPNYGVPVPPMFDGRIPVDPSQMIETNCNCFMGGMDNTVQLGGQMVFPQPPTFWPQGPNYFQNQAGTQPRFPPLTQSTPGIPPTFVSSQTSTNSEMMFSNQPQMQFAFATSQPTTAMYSNQNPMLFNQNSFSSSPYPAQTATPISSQTVTGDPPPQVLMFNNDQLRPTSRTNKSLYDEEGNQGGRTGNLRGFMVNSSQSSTAASSPAASVHTSFNTQNQRLCRQFSDGSTAPCSFMPNNFVMMRPIAVRCSTPGTNRNSRSPTPANEMSHFGGQRVSIQQPVIPGMIQHDPSLAALSQQPVLRFLGPLYPQDTIRPRKATKNFRPTGLPPSGR